MWDSSKRLTKSLISVRVYDVDMPFYICLSVQEAHNDVVTFNKLMDEGQQDGSAVKYTCY